MPRISFVTNDDFVDGTDTASPENENIDICRRCWPKRMSLVPQERIKDGFWSENDDHPDYDDDDDYTCQLCGRKLTCADC